MTTQGNAPQPTALAAHGVRGQSKLKTLLGIGAGNAV